MKKLLLGILLSLFATFAEAQTCPTRLPGDSTNACASTAFVQNAIIGVTGITSIGGMTGPAITCGSGLTCSGNSISVSASTAPGGSNTQIQYNNSNAFGGTSTFTYASSVPTVTRNSASGFTIRDAASSSSSVVIGVQTAGSVPSTAVNGPFAVGNTGNLLSELFTANNINGYSTYEIGAPNGTLILQANGTHNTHPTISLGDSSSNCCYIPALGTQPGMLFTYGQQTIASGPGPFPFNIANFGLNTGANSRDVHINVFSGQGGANESQAGIFFWLMQGSPSLTEAECAGTCGTQQGDNIWQIGGFPYATNGFVQTENSSIRGHNNQNCTNTGGPPPVEGNTSCGGNIVFYNVRQNTGGNLIVGGFYAEGTFAVGNWAAAGNAFTGGDGTITFKNGTCPAAQAGGGVLCVESGALKYRGEGGTLTPLAPS